MNGSINQILSKSKSFLKANSPTLLACAAVVGLVVTAVSAVKDTKKATVRLEEATNEKGEELTKTEMVLTALPAYIPTVLSTAATAICIFGVGSISRHAQASMAGAYALINNSYEQYKGKVKELYGEEAHEKIMQSIAAEEYDKDHWVYAPTLGDVITLGFDDEHEKIHLFYDEYSKRYFKSTMSTVLQAEYHINRNFLLRGETFISEFYEFLGLKKQEDFSSQVWDILEWEEAEMFPWIEFNHIPGELEDGTPYCIIEILTPPSP